MSRNEVGFSGDDHLKTYRWNRIVGVLDEFIPKWRRIEYDPDGNLLGDSAADAITEAVIAQATAPAQDYAEWETSYTKKLVDELGNIVSFPWQGNPPRNATEKAARLLKQYHATQHEVYEQRDIAREEVTQLKPHAEAWTAVWDQLTADGRWLKGGSYQAAAVAEIKRLQALDTGAQENAKRASAQKALMTLARIDHLAAVDVLKCFGAERFSAIPSSKYADLHAAIRIALEKISHNGLQASNALSQIDDTVA